MPPMLFCERQGNTFEVIRMFRGKYLNLEECASGSPQSSQENAEPRHEPGTLNIREALVAQFACACRSKSVRSSPSMRDLERRRDVRPSPAAEETTPLQRLTAKCHNRN
jgi:hypothetical protein